MAELGVKCRDCKKSPRNCTCYEFRIQGVDGKVCVYVDNVATEPVRGQEARTWQPRRNAKVWRSPTYVDAYGPVMYITDEAVLAEVDEKIKNGEFSLMDYKEREGCRVRNFERDLVRRMPFLRKARQQRAKVLAG